MPPIAHGQLLADLPPPGPEEDVRPLFANGALRVERIVSHGQVSPVGFWFDQAEDEWVMVIQGQARLEFADGRSQDLGPGDWVAIPAHLRHRVASTAVPTVWLAVHGGTEHPGGEGV